MKRSLLITEDEKRRISNMHKKAILKEQTQSPEAGGETVNRKLYDTYLQIQGMLKECTQILAGEEKSKFINGGFFLKGAYCNVKKGGPQSVMFEIVNSAGKQVIVGDFNARNEKPTLAATFTIAQTQPYNNESVKAPFNVKNRVQDGFNNFIPNLAPSFKSWVDKFAPTLAEFLNTAIFTFPDKPGTATFQSWGDADMIAGGNVPVKTTT